LIDVVKNNPFRILGLTATASDKEITKRVAELEVYMKMGKRIRYDMDFPFLGNFKRTSETLQDAVNKLNKPVERIFYSLFWFDNIDEFEFEKLREENINEAITIIKNSCDNRKIINLDQFSGYKNLSIFYLYLVYNDDEYEEKYFRDYFYAFSKCLTSNYLSNYLKAILKNKNKVDSNLIIKKYLDVVSDIINEYLCIDLEDDREFIERHIDSLSSYPDEIKKYIRDKYIQEALIIIRKALNKCTKIRKANSEDAYESGANLYYDTDECLAFLKHKYNFSDVRYQTIADKLAEEILQCSVDYFNRYYDSDDNIDPCEESLELSEYADSIAVGERLKEKIAKDLKTTQEWINTYEDRDKQNQIDYHLDFIHNQIDILPNLKNKTLFNDINNYPNVVDKFIFECEKHLLELKNLLGVDLLYWKVSNSVVNNAMNIIITYANNKMDKSPIIYLLDDLAKIEMFGETKNRFLKNMEEIINDYRSYLESIKKLDIELKKINKKKKIRFYSIISIVFVIIFIISISKNNEQANISKSTNNISEIINEEKPSTRITFETPKIELITPKVYKPKEVVKISKYKGNQLENGASPYNSYFGYGVYNKKYYNEITLKNGYSTDAIVCLVNYYSKKTIRNEYIKKNTNFKMTNIQSGTYYIKVFSGNDWNPEKLLANGRIRGGFETDISYSVSDNQDDLIQLEQTEDYSGIEYSIYTITLYQVSNGNMESEPIKEKDFFK